MLCLKYSLLTAGNPKGCFGLSSFFGISCSEIFLNIILSCKVSGVQKLISVYRDIAKRCDYALHLGLTEAGMGSKGIVASTASIGVLLQEGIGDTIRVSLSSDPVDEVKVGWDILRSLKIRSRGINFIACPSCSRMNFDVIGTMNKLESRLEDIKENLDVAVIGCYVNGPGESKHTDIGVTGGSPKNLIYIDGKPDHKVESLDLADHLEKTIRDKIKERNEKEASIIAKI